MKRAPVKALAGLAAFIVIFIVIAAALGSSHPKGSTAATTAATTAPAVPAATTSAPPSPNPAGTYSGSCSYTLSTNFSNYTADAGTLTGEVDVINTGNIGTIVHVRITWPQEGYGPIVMARTVHLAAGTTRPVSFHQVAGQNVISNLQNWQQGHNDNDGCTYKATITGTFGNAS